MSKRLYLQLNIEKQETKQIKQFYEKKGEKKHYDKK